MPEPANLQGLARRRLVLGIGAGAATFAIASLPGGLALLVRGERPITKPAGSAATTSETAGKQEMVDV